MDVLFKLTELGFLNCFEVLWSKVGAFNYGRSLSLSVNKYQKEPPRLLGKFAYIWRSGDLPSLKRLIYVVLMFYRHY